MVVVASEEDKLRYAATLAGLADKTDEAIKALLMVQAIIHQLPRVYRVAAWQGVIEAMEGQGLDENHLIISESNESQRALNHPLSTELKNAIASYVIRKLHKKPPTAP